MGKGSGTCASRAPLLLDDAGTVVVETDWLRDPEWSAAVLEGPISTRYLKQKFALDDDGLAHRMMPFVERGYIEMRETVEVGGTIDTRRGYRRLDLARRTRSCERWAKLKPYERDILELFDPGTAHSYTNQVLTHTDIHARTGLHKRSVTAALEGLRDAGLVWQNSARSKRGHSLSATCRQTILDVRNTGGTVPEPTPVDSPLPTVEPRLVAGPAGEPDFRLLAMGEISLERDAESEIDSAELEAVCDGMVQRGLLVKRYHRIVSSTEGVWDEFETSVDYTRTDAGTLRLYDERLSLLPYAAQETMGALVARQANSSYSSHMRPVVVQHGELRAETDIPPKELSTALAALVSEGILERTRRTRWGVTESGWGFTPEGLEAACLLHARA